MLKTSLMSHKVELRTLFLTRSLTLIQYLDMWCGRLAFLLSRPFGRGFEEATYL